MRRPAQPDRTAPQRCGAALFFSAGAGHAANKKAPEGLRDPPGRDSGVRARCGQHHACAQHQVCQPAAGAGLDQLGILHHGAHRTASLNLFPLSLFHHASLLLLCRSPVVFLHYITSAL